MRTVLTCAALLSLFVQTGLSDELVPTAIVKLNSTISDLNFSSDRAWIYFLNTSEGKIQRLDTAKRKLDSAEVEVVEGSGRMAMSPDGKTLFVCASEGQSGKIQVVDLAALKINSTFKIRFDPFDIKAGSGLVYATGGSGQWTNVVSIDPKKKTIVGKVARCFQQAFLEITPDGKRLYHCSPGSSPASIEGIWQSGGTSMARSENDNPVGGWFQITPDGKFLVSSTGTVLRLAKSAKDDLKPVAKVEKHLSCAVDKNGKVFLVATPEGSLKVYSYPDFELKDSFDLKAPACRMLLDGASSTLYCAAETKKAGKIERLVRKSPIGVGDIHIYDVSKITSADSK